MKALLVSILLLAGADFAFNHGAVCRRIGSALTHFGSATGEAAGDSIFAK